MWNIKSVCLYKFFNITVRIIKKSKICRRKRLAFTVRDDFFCIKINNQKKKNKYTGTF